MNIKQGNILEFTDGTKRKVLGVCGEVYVLSYKNDYELLSLETMYTIKELRKRGLIEPKEKWTPKKGENYYYPFIEHDDNELVVECSVWEGVLFDSLKRNKGFGIYRTIEEAKVALDKIEALRKEINP